MDLKPLLEKKGGKIVLVVLDGLGGLPVREDGKTELELADTPNLDALARRSACGLHVPVDYGITPGSGPGHLALFGYDPKEYQIGRGILEALGLGMEVRETDVALRGNFATVRYEGDKPVVVDRRAGRLPTEENRRIVAKIAEKVKEVDGVKVLIKSGKEHRVAVVLRFPEPLPPGSDEINDTDPQAVGVPPLKAEGKNPNARRVAEVINKLSKAVAEVIKDEPKGNYLLFRGAAQKPQIEPFSVRYGLRAAAIAVYPMYKGLAKLVGMEEVNPEGETIADEIETLKRVWNDYDFFFLHVKKTDSYGEDGNAEGKIKVLEEFDRELPKILELEPAVLIITGDHSTPSVLRGHSWHPVPVLLHSPFVLGQTSRAFTERECLKGELGIFPGYKLMQLALANALRLKKFGA
ncbi:MAG: 2,3-bisphosphoglycerate-independent phosphoglycerate mutase [Aquificae bacterium]|nr:2,3-bisphosphoglycerate-independent phosphoglycerate mutase [Aquificota bacterium]